MRAARLAAQDKWYVFQNLPGFSDWQVSNNGNYELHGWQGVPGDPATWNASDYCARPQNACDTTRATPNT